jgi:hypothetical protein
MGVGCSSILEIILFPPFKKISKELYWTTHNSFPAKQYASPATCILVFILKFCHFNYFLLLLNSPAKIVQF